MLQYDFTLDKSSYLRFNREYLKHMQNESKSSTLSVLNFVFIALMSGSAVFLCLAAGNKIQDDAVSTTALSILFISTLISWSINAKLIESITNAHYDLNGLGKIGTQSILIDENGVRIKMEKGDVNLGWQGIHNICVGRCAITFMSEVSTFFLPISCIMPNPNDFESDSFLTFKNTVEQLSKMPLIYLGNSQG